MHADISGVILAGGRGSRLGGDDKGLIDVAGRPMISRVIDRFAPQVGSLVINANRNVERYREFGYSVLGDLAPDFAGPLAGISTALNVCPTQWLASAPCDSPFLPVDFVARLDAARVAHDVDISVAACADRPQPVFILLPVYLAESITQYLRDGGRKITSWYRQHRHIEVDFGSDDSAFANVNTAEDIANVSSRLSNA